MKLTITLRPDVEGKVFISIINIRGAFGANVIVNDSSNNNSFCNYGSLCVVQCEFYHQNITQEEGERGLEFKAYAGP